MRAIYTRFPFSVYILIFIIDYNVYRLAWANMLLARVSDSVDLHFSENMIPTWDDRRLTESTRPLQCQMIHQTHKMSLQKSCCRRLRPLQVALKG